MAGCRCSAISPRELGFRRTLLVADAGIVQAGFVERARAIPGGRRHRRRRRFTTSAPIPTRRWSSAAGACAAEARVDSIVALGGGSSLDCAKGINFVLTNGGTMRDYRGYGKATRPMLPMIGVPTTAGTGSDAQSLRADLGRRDAREDGLRRSEGGVPHRAARSRADGLTAARADGDRRLRRHLARRRVVRHHARAPRLSDLFAREAWRLLSGALRAWSSTRRTISRPAAPCCSGAHFAGLAIEQSMLGATHACANPLTARYGTTHGVAIAVMLPHVVRWNAAVVVGDRYGELLRVGRLEERRRSGRHLAERLRGLARRRRPAGDACAISACRAPIFRRWPTPPRRSGPARSTRGRSTPTAAARQLYERAYLSRRRRAQSGRSVLSRLRQPEARDEADDVRGRADHRRGVGQLDRHGARPASTAPAMS